MRTSRFTGCTAGGRFLLPFLEFLPFRPVTLVILVGLEEQAIREYIWVQARRRRCRRSGGR